MSGKRFFNIGTATTPQKKTAIRKAANGTLDVTSFEYVKKKFRMALFNPLRKRMNEGWWTENDVWDFAEECVEDAFLRIKEYKPQYKFRTFLAEIIIKPKLDRLYKDKKKETDTQKDYAQEISHSSGSLDDELKPNLEKEIAGDVLKQLKAQDKVKYEVFCYREFDGWEYKNIAAECGITKANARQIYNRVKKETIPELFCQISQHSKYLDQDMKIRQDIFNLIKKEIKDK
jgi:RNA polymerase sigma factor (sigma-70 family)